LPLSLTRKKGKQKARERQRDLKMKIDKGRGREEHTERKREKNRKRWRQFPENLRGVTKCIFIIFGDAILMLFSNISTKTRKKFLLQ